MARVEFEFGDTSLEGEVVENRVPYYGEYLVRNDDGEYEINEEYIEEYVGA